MPGDSAPGALPVPLPPFDELTVRVHALATAEFATIRLRILKLGARVIETASRVRLAFAAACPDDTLIRDIAAALMPAGP